ncbi:MAG TPA: hypothetical protein VI409_03865 [Gaiellaceae bacterium]|nr:hypothetical protein [Gaiellaceae bacterium]
MSRKPQPDVPKQQKTPKGLDPVPKRREFMDALRWVVKPVKKPKSS